MLRCWVYRDDIKNIFSVEISKDETVGGLRWIIKNKKSVRFRGVEANKLRLYCIPTPWDDDERLKDALTQLSLEDKSCLDPKTEVSKLFSGSDQWEEWLVVVDGPNSDASVKEPPVTVVTDLTLFCWVRDDMTGSILPVKTSSTETVATLKIAIKNSKPLHFRDVDADDLTLYKFPLPCGEHDTPERVLGTRTVSSLGQPLGDLQELSDIFMPLSADRQLHVIVDSLTLSCQCWIRGAEPENSLLVRIPMKASVDDLKVAIKAAFAGSLDVQSLDRLKLYKITVYEEAKVNEHLSAIGSGRLLRGNESVRQVTNDVPLFSRTQVVVEPGAGHPTLAGSVTSSKREHPEDPFEANKRIRRRFAILPMQTPSVIGTPSNFYAHYQKKLEPRIRCGRPEENQGPFPLVLAHRIFATFVSECETYKPSDEDFMFILKLSQCMRQFPDGKDRRLQFQACMREYGISLTEEKIEGTEYTTDGDARVGGFPYLITEAKDFGASKGDPYIQAAAYHLAATQSWLRMHPGDVRALPCIHIFYNGPVLGFAGSMLTEEFDVNVLGPILPLFYHQTDIDLQIRCAKMFGALKNSVTALKQYYEGTMLQAYADTRFPWITQYDTITLPTETHEYKYLHRMDSGGLLYICQHIHDEKRILVKFVRTYSKDAHLVSAANDGAPTLLGHCNVLSCGWSVVVMELLEEPDWVPGLKIVDVAEQRMVRDEVREHVLALHQHGFVHGDIRPQNILVKRPGSRHGHTLSVRLVDFDWAGEIDKAKYPFLVNPDLGYGFKRPSDVKGGGIITTEHDLAMVQLMYLP